MTPAEAIAELRSLRNALQKAKNRVIGWTNSGHMASAIGTAEGAIEGAITRLDVMANRIEKEAERDSI